MLKNCVNCTVVLTDLNWDTWNKERKYYICTACKNLRIRTSRAYSNKRKTKITRIHNRSEIQRRLIRKFNDVLISAARRNIEFLLSRDEFIAITEKPCVYCNSESTKQKPNGLDRIDSSKSYTLDNVASCCKLCNFGKNQLTVEEYIQHCEKVVNNFNTLRRVSI